MVADAVMLLLVSVCVVSVEKSATVPIAAGVSLVTAAVVILCREVVVKVAIPCHGLTSATREGGEGGAVAELPIVEVLCHEIVGRSFDVCHGSSIRGQQREWGQAETTWSGVTFNHLIGAPLVMRQIVAGSSMARAIRYAPLMVGV